MPITLCILYIFTTVLLSKMSWKLWPVENQSSLFYAVKGTLIMLLLIDILYTIAFGMIIFYGLVLSYSEPIDEYVPDGMSKVNSF